MTESPLTPARVAQLQDCFAQALDYPDAEREEFLQGTAASDPDLAARVRRLLAAHEQTGTALESPIGRATPHSAAPGNDPWIGSHVGAYHVVSQVGVGGMGTVYEAVRDDDQYRTRVAIKMLRQHARTEAALQRFRDERQILANLHHPNIAVLLDGGITADGQPYFVMEYLEGQPITAWCDARHATVSERLALFERVCAAVQYAHQSLVVHRDLKPGNIMVTSNGEVKLLDFGIAKLLPSQDESGNDLTPVTQVGARAYTPEYASPEQLLGLPVGTRSDVYALGVMLYELLTGARPFDLTGKSPGEIERIVRDVAPPRPSTVLSPGRELLLGERSAQRAQARVAGDLDAIVLQALRKEPERRYGSAEELAADVRAHLDGLPVRARPEGIGYRLGKLVRRRRIEVAAIAVALLFLVAGVIATALRTREAILERERATQVTAFLTTMLGAANPASFGKDVQVRTVLDSAAAQADTLRNRPALESDVREVIGGTYNALGEFQLAEAQFRRRLAIAQAQDPAGSRAVALAYSQVSATLELEGRYGEADSVLGLASPLFDRFGYPDAQSRADALDRRGSLLLHLGKMAEAEPYLAQALAVQLQIVPVNDSARGYAQANLAVVRSELGNNQSAESLLIQAVASAKRAYGEVHPLVAAVLSPLATVQERAGEMDRADSTYRTALAMRLQLLGAEHPDYAWTMVNYADHLRLVGRYSEAAAWSYKVLALRGKSLTDAHPMVAAVMSILGRSLDHMDSLATGGRWLQQSLEIRRSNLPKGHFLIASSESILGEHLVLAGQYAEAERHLLSGERALVAARGESAPIVHDARQRLVDLYKAWQKPDQAAKWQAQLKG